MPKFIGITSRGLIAPLAEELKTLGIEVVRATTEGAEFEASWEDLYRLHRQCRIASRFLLPVAKFTAYNEDDLYYGVLRQHNFTSYISPQQKLRIEAHTRGHRGLHDQRFVALKVKDGIVDQFWAKFDARPSIGTEENADLRVVVRIIGTEVSLAIDLTGETLSARGYRQFAGEAPLRETVAAGLLRLSGWSAPRPLVDPFCGSGTILIEAALSAAGPTASKRRRPFAFEKLDQFDRAAFNKAAGREARRSAPNKPFLFGYDRDEEVLEKGRANARLAGVENWISFVKRDARELSAPPVDAGVLITNPPYGERLEDRGNVQRLMFDFSRTLKTSFKGWDAWILSGNPEASAALKLKSKLKVPVWNGPIECRFLNYPLQ